MPADDETKQNQSYGMKIRPKIRKYGMKEGMDESYFAANSMEDGNNSREEPTDGENAQFFKIPKREFKILDRKIKEKGYLDNMVWTSEYTAANFIPLSLTKQFQQPLNQYYLAIMLLQMVPWISNTEGQPTILYTFVPMLTLCVLLDLIEDRQKFINDFQENNCRVHKIKQKSSDEDNSSTWASL